jgi:hypothetical protein
MSRCEPRWHARRRRRKRQARWRGRPNNAQTIGSRARSADVSSTRRPWPAHGEGSPDARVLRVYHARLAGVTGDSEGAGNPPPFLQPPPGRSEAEWVWALIADFQALADALAKLSTATGSSGLIRFSTVQALVKFLAPDIPPASLALLFGLLRPAEVKLQGDLIRGAVAAGVAVLRSTNMDNPQIERWLDEEIQRRALDFTRQDAMRWFYDCSNVKASISRATSEMFRIHRPEPSLSLTEAAAKDQMVQILDAAVAMKAGSLKRSGRRRG